MSLIITIPTAEGAVVATDTLMIVGQVKEQRSKIHRLNSKIVWSATGEYALIQKVASALAAYQENSQSLKDLAPAIGSIVKGSVKDLLNLDFRTEIYLNNLNAISQLHRADFVFVESGSIPTILHVNIFGSAVWIQEQPFFIGAGDVFVGHMFQKYKDLQLSLSAATIIAYRLIEEAIESQMFGLGGPANIWQLTSNGALQLKSEDIRGLQETVKTIRSHEVAVFEKNLAIGVSH